MDFKALQHAVALADAASFVRAAETVALTQSALSRSIMALEQELGATLFDRTPAGVRPTAAGRMLVERARRILADTRALKDAISHGHGDMAGALSLGVVPAIAATALPQSLAWFVEHCPKLRIGAKVDAVGPLCQLLRREQIEFFIAIDGVVRHDPDLELRPIGKIRAGALFCRAGHPLAGRTALRTADLLQFPLAVADTEKTLLQTLRALLGAAAGTPVDFRIVCDNLYVLQRVTALTDALLITSQGGMRELVAAGDIVELPLPATATVPATAAVLAVAIKGRTLSPAAVRFIERIRESLWSGG